mmetsp:Transcript_7095/g.17306  ORF Transcript_7095/g.17306 Transcript_7095/m.17306 type:complete len:264 (-) Transcript_7095:541-1332(-)
MTSTACYLGTSRSEAIETDSFSIESRFCCMFPVSLSGILSPRVDTVVVTVAVAVAVVCNGVVDTAAFVAVVAVVASLRLELNQGIREENCAPDRNRYGDEVLGHSACREAVTQLADQPSDGRQEGFVRLEHFVSYHVERVREGRPSDTRRRALDRRSNQPIAVVGGRGRILDRGQPEFHEILDQNGGAVFRHRFQYPGARAVPQPTEAVVAVDVTDRLHRVGEARFRVLERDARPNDWLVDALDQRADHEGRDHRRPDVRDAQ